MSCAHEVADRETAAYDGACPICQGKEIERLREENERLRFLIQKHINHRDGEPLDVISVYEAIRHQR